MRLPIKQIAKLPPEQQYHAMMALFHVLLAPWTLAAFFARLCGYRNAVARASVELPLEVGTRRFEGTLKQIAFDYDRATRVG